MSTWKEYDTIMFMGELCCEKIKNLIDHHGLQ